MAYHKKPSRWHERGPRATFGVNVVRTVLEASGYTCYLCGGPATEVDHIIPVAEGGSSYMINAGAICTSCHTEKSRQEAARGYQRRLAKLRLPEEPHPFDWS